MIDLIFAKKPHKTVSEIDYVALYGSYARFRPAGEREAQNRLIDQHDKVRFWSSGRGFLVWCQIAVGAIYFSLPYLFVKN